MRRQKGTRKKHARTQRKTRRVQRGGIKCDEPTTWTPFKYDDNSCWLDTFLLAFLHHPNAAIDAYLLDAKDNINTMKSIINYPEELYIIKRRKTILKRLLKIRDRLRKTFSEAISEKALEKIREEIRDALSQCPKGDIFEKGEMSSTAEIFDFLTNILNLPRTIQYIEKQGNLPNIVRSIHSITLTGFDGIMAMEEIDISGILTQVKTHIDERYPERSTTMQYKSFGDIVPINIERDDYEGGIIKTPVKLEKYIKLKTDYNIDSTYKLVSVICNIGAHFVTYIACDSNDSWLFYNDLNKESKRIINVGNIDSWWNKKIPGSSTKTPNKYTTWLLYVKI